ncbi:MAG: hypothetical protein U1E27_10860 [Kiritimatiellia bacterium]|nr:hypothetical protein [Kiritimatiellia bacterium]
MKRILLWTAVLALTLAFGWMPARASEGNHRFGLAATYWVALDDIDVNDLDDNGLTLALSFQYRPSLVGLELALELLPDRFGEDAVAPQAYFILGRTLYAAAGVGIVYRDGDFADDPFFAFRAGFDFEIFPAIYLDLFASYRFNDTTDLEDEGEKIDTDTVFLGAAVRVRF